MYKSKLQNVTKYALHFLSIVVFFDSKQCKFTTTFIFTRFITVFENSFYMFLSGAGLIAKILSLIHCHYLSRYERTALTVATYRLITMSSNCDVFYTAPKIVY